MGIRNWEWELVVGNRLYDKIKEEVILMYAELNKDLESLEKRVADLRVSL